VGSDHHIIPAIRTIDPAGDPLSLSAILLDDDYYSWLRAGRRVVDGLPMVRAEHLIPLKVRALELLHQKSRTQLMPTISRQPSLGPRGENHPGQCIHLDLPLKMSFV